MRRAYAHGLIMDLLIGQTKMTALLRRSPLRQRPITWSSNPRNMPNSIQLLPFIIRPSAVEIRAGKLGGLNLDFLVTGLINAGLVIVEGVVPHGNLDHLNAKMVQDARILQARGEESPYNYNKANLQQDAPPYAEYFHPSIFINPIVTQITSSILGPQPKWTFCSGNTAMPLLPEDSPQRQPVHSDADFAYPDRPFAYVINIPLVDMTPLNGSTEIWFESHEHEGGYTVQEGAHGERASGRIKPEILESQVKNRSFPCQLFVKKGSIIIRDLRLWHAGMPNWSQKPRVMLALIHFASWYKNHMRLEFADDIKPILDGLQRLDRLGLEIPVDWVSKQQAMDRYLNRPFGNTYDFDQHP